MDARAKILLVDDDPINLEILEIHLQSAGYECTSISDPTFALKELENNPETYWLVLLDRMMPNLNGFEMLAKIKQNFNLSHIQVVMQTGVADQQDIIDGMEAGAVYFLIKPFDRKSLLNLVEMLSKRRTQTANKEAHES